jgi:hypothetical protein
MRNLYTLDHRRDNSLTVIQHYGSIGDGTCGVFRISAEDGELLVIASTGGGWEHVSVSMRSRCPSWAEMEHVKRLFFKDDETVMQLHVPVSQHINEHPYCLHLWRPIKRGIPRPPAWMVASATHGQRKP